MCVILYKVTVDADFIRTMTTKCVIDIIKQTKFYGLRNNIDSDTNAMERFGSLVSSFVLTVSTNNLLVTGN